METTKPFMICHTKSLDINLLEIFALEYTVIVYEESLGVCYELYSKD